MIQHRNANLSIEIADAVEQVLLRRQIDPPSVPHASSGRQYERPLNSAETARLGGLAKSIYRARRDRDAIFGGMDVSFGEPGWDILLALYHARCEQRPVSVSSACYASAGPPTTGLRYLATLEARGLVERQFDPLDRRRCFVRLSAAAMSMMDLWLLRVTVAEQPDSKQR